MRPAPTFFITSSRARGDVGLARAGDRCIGRFASIDEALAEARRLGGANVDVQVEVGR